MRSRSDEQITKLESEFGAARSASVRALGQFIDGGDVGVCPPMHQPPWSGPMRPVHCAIPTRYRRCL